MASKGDTTAFPPPPSAKAESLKIMNLPDLNVLSLPAGPEDFAADLEATCTPSLTKLCLNQSRFEVKVRWKDFQGFQGDGQAVTLTADTGYFWFFSSNNVELAIKVLDGRLINGRFWVFYGALSNVEYSIEVKDTVTGNIVTYTNPSGAFASRADTGAFVP